MDAYGFHVGDKIYTETPAFAAATGEWATIEFIGSEHSVLASACGHQFTIFTQHLSLFKFYKRKPTIDGLITLGDDLCAAIHDAEWLSRGKPALCGPTPHMRDASNAWAAAIGDK